MIDESITAEDQRRMHNAEVAMRIAEANKLSFIDFFKYFLTGLPTIVILIGIIYLFYLYPIVFEILLSIGAIVGLIIIIIALGMFILDEY